MARSQASTERARRDEAATTRERRAEAASAGGRDALRQSAMMAHLLDALEAGQDIGHYGQLTFAMVARHFLPEAELIELLTQQPDLDETRARALVRQVQERDYSPPRRERILEWQRQQEFPIIPNPDDPDSGNVYRELRFPDAVYEHIEEYRVEQAEAQAADSERAR